MNNKCAIYGINTVLKTRVLEQLLVGKSAAMGELCDLQRNLLLY